MTGKARLRTFVAEPLTADVKTSLQRLCRLPDVAAVAAMPDVHLAKGVCVGAVVATRQTLMPDAVGGDIGCGMAALRLGADASVLADRRAAGRVLAMLGARVPAIQHPSKDARLPSALASRPLSAPVLERKKARVGRVQFGTLGRGNHFVELQSSEDGGLWLMLHSGSRGMGQSIREHHSRASPGLARIPADAEEGRAYLGDLAWALDYARLSRRRMAEAAAGGLADLLGASPDWDTYADCHHNFVRREQHAGQDLWVHRKGAISAREGEPGIIPGSMGAPSYHVTGRGHPASLCSSSHGAGRAMSRTDARRRITAAGLERQMTGIWFDRRLTNRLRDEAPAAYKDISRVMRAQKKLTRIARKLMPVLVYKAA